MNSNSTLEDSLELKKLDKLEMSRKRKFKVLGKEVLYNHITNFTEDRIGLYNEAITQYEYGDMLRIDTSATDIYNEPVKGLYSLWLRSDFILSEGLSGFWSIFRKLQGEYNGEIQQK